MPRAALLLAEMDATYERVRRRLDGLTDDEFFWEPAPGCWTIRQEGDRWTYDYAVPDPIPAPVTTIGWRLVHIVDCKVMYHEYAYGEGRLTFPELPTPHTAATAVAGLDASHQVLRADLAGLADADLDAQVRTNWGEQWPAWRILWTMIHHDAHHGAHHGAEIGCLRDMYRATRATRTTRPGAVT